MLGISPSTLRRRRTAGPLTPQESDRLVCLAEVVARAHRALDSAESARQWLRAPHALLGGASSLHPQLSPPTPLPLPQSPAGSHI
ncbi:antitoxin Xre-like helix-turn-helix domain-containing protein [Salinibacter ruber]|uniref:antitoxin Xre-like helix-turn-helix domain-containing protein n=1 Tax=Salinibacter ruber TaxID=146919 RepID=UPI00355C5855